VYNFREFTSDYQFLRFLATKDIYFLLAYGHIPYAVVDARRCNILTGSAVRLGEASSLF
jgi:hypothetical protein